MGHKFAEIAFTTAVKKVQSEQKSRAGYARWENSLDVNHLLSEQEVDFIATRDSFYMASVSETNWPYVQHRGGPVGFLKVIDEKTIGFADYSGNRQYISTGNFSNNDRVSLFLMDYPSKSRLKILGRISIVNGDNTQELALLKSTNSSAPIERGFIIHIEGFDWNCPKYITPRYTETQIKNFIEPIQQENAQLKTVLAQQAPSEREIKKPLPPFTRETAEQKIRMAEDGWNGKNPEKIALAYSQESIWRNRNEFVTGRAQIIELLTRKWQKECNYRLIKELWAYNDNRIAVRFAYEYQDLDEQWFRAYGNENWQFNEQGLMTHRHASINDLKISASERKFHWPLGVRPLEHAGLTDLGL
jgi:nuclear transport factor 2 (NTF2) superfamily protein/predicted pyridoxine 5'-phosphate oxidase superfamily flavin-nucleotide-binding protein